jgi:hypothetical protein
MSTSLCSAAVLNVLTSTSPVVDLRAPRIHGHLLRLRRIASAFERDPAAPPPRQPLTGPAAAHGPGVDGSMTEANPLKGETPPAPATSCLQVRSQRLYPVRAAPVFARFIPIPHGYSWLFT